MTQVEIISKLKEPFTSKEIEWKIQTATQDKVRGMAVAYVDSRAIQKRLDETVGAFNWQNTYMPWQEKSQVCGLSIYCEDRKEWVTKFDGAENTDFEPIKGGLSDAFKRAASLWGIGRYLYEIDGIWVEIEQKGKSYTQIYGNRISVGSYVASKFSGWHYVDCIYEVSKIGHDACGHTYAVLIPQLSYPQDREQIKSKFPRIYEWMFYGSRPSALRYKGDAEIAYIPASKPGDQIVYAELFEACGGLYIHSDFFNFTWEKAEPIDINGNEHLCLTTDWYFHFTCYKYTWAGILAECGGKLCAFKYRVERLVTYRGKHYAEFSYVGEFGFFTEFLYETKHLRNINPAPKEEIDKDFLPPVAEYLLHRAKLVPRPLTHEQYTSIQASLVPKPLHIVEGKE